tara:strand:+ start:168 stop:428 length:261 start_codon:yes stop_codon:yes gene_type:complete
MTIEKQEARSKIITNDDLGFTNYNLERSKEKDNSRQAAKKVIGSLDTNFTDYIDKEKLKMDQITKYTIQQTILNDILNYHIYCCIC